MPPATSRGRSTSECTSPPTVWSRHDSREEPYSLDLPAPGLCSALARLLSAMRLTVEGQADESLSGTIGLPEILGVADPARLDLGRTWRPRPLRDLLRVPIGVGATGNTVMLDLKESAHGGMGPHGMVVGATGSGKSEMLRTLVSSLAIGHAPERLALMLVDFKGGATFAPMSDIPHIAGMITNLQDDLTLVDRMRDALYGEMQRRQEILKEAGNLPNVTAYQERVDAGEDLAPLPHLLVIVDEFSELLTAKPDFAELFVAIGRIGRSIGVHLLLATQRLEMGKIRGLESHLSYRISLRTFSESESRDAIGVPDAFHLPPEPGSGYLRVDTTVFDRFKAALVSAAYQPPGDGPRTTVPVVPYVAVNGLGAWVAQQAAAADHTDTASAETARRPAGSAPSVLDVLCDQIRDVDRPRVRQVWLDPLPDRLPLGSLISTEDTSDPTTCAAVLGLVDDPAKQEQFPLLWDFTGGGANLVVTGSPQTGKSTLLRTLILSASAGYAPGDVAFYCIDYGGGSLSALRDLPHVASVVSRVDPERIRRTVNDVRAALDHREALFRERGLDSMGAYRRARSAGELPDERPGTSSWSWTAGAPSATSSTTSTTRSPTSQHEAPTSACTWSSPSPRRCRCGCGCRGPWAVGWSCGSTTSTTRSSTARSWSRSPGTPPAEGSRGRASRRSSSRRPCRCSTSTMTTRRASARWSRPSSPSGASEPWPAWRSCLPSSPPPTCPSSTEATPAPSSALSELNLGPAEISLLGADPHLQVYGDGETGKSNLLKLLIWNLRGHPLAGGDRHRGRRLPPLPAGRRARGVPPRLRHRSRAGRAAWPPRWPRPSAGASPGPT